MEKIGEGLENLLIKVLIPALVAISIKIAIASRKSNMTVFNIVTSIVIGVGSAYLFSGVIMNNFSDEWIPLVIALITISGEKLGNWVIYKFSIDQFIEALIERYYRK